jgi:hypothetical protein
LSKRKAGVISHGERNVKRDERKLDQMLRQRDNDARSLPQWREDVRTWSG